MVEVKICGIKNREQGQAIANLGANYLGFICVSNSPRYLPPDDIKNIIDHLPSHVKTVGVFADHSLTEINNVLHQTGIDIVQLHGKESLDYCQELKLNLPNNVKIIKAWRLNDLTDLKIIYSYGNIVDYLLLDAYHPAALGGTGITLNWQELTNFQPSCPWFLAGGLNPQNIQSALTILHPQGIDLSSGVEISPGNKDLNQVAALFQQLKQKY